MGKLKNYLCNRKFSLFPKKTDLQALMKFYDVDCDGNVSYEEFIRGLRDELSTRKKAMVDRAFDIMDMDKCGKLTVKDICGRFDVT